MTLSGLGDAERRVRYQQSNGGLSPEYVAFGTYQPRADGTLDLRLWEGERSSIAWQAHAQVSHGVLQLRYPDPADGPDIVETYERR